MSSNNNKINKCDYGYLKDKLKKEIIKTLILFIVPICILIFGILKEGSRMNIFTLIAVLGLLPAANNFVTLIMVIKAQKWICAEDLYKKIKDSVDDNRVKIRYDLYMTGYEKSFPIQSICCIGNSLFGYSFAKINESKFEEHLKPLLSQNGLKVGNVKIFDNEDKYIQRLIGAISSVSESNDEQESLQDDHDLKVLRLMENISL